MGLVDALQVHEEEAGSHAIDVVSFVDQLSDVFLGDLPVACIA